MNNKTAPLCALAILLAFLYFGINERSRNLPETTRIKESLILMDTLVEITLYGRKDSVENALKDIKEEMSRLEQIFNRHEATAFAGQLESQKALRSEPWTGNAPPEYIDLLQRARETTKISRGAFNPTIAPVIDLWNFADSKDPAVPDQDKINDRLGLSDWNLIEANSTDGTVSFKKKDVSVDCGGIGKGYIVDKAILMLRDRNIDAALINGGGDLKTFGTKPDGSSFRIGIQDPNKSGNLAGILNITDCAVATSGDYERGFSIDSKYYHHLLTPQTGHPARLSRSCTVVATDALSADAFATAIFILGPEEGIELAEAVDSVEAMVITSQMNMVFSSGFGKYLEQKCLKENNE